MYQPKDKFKFTKPKFSKGEAVKHISNGVSYIVTAIMPEAGGWWYGLDNVKYFVHENELVKDALQ